MFKIEIAPAVMKSLKFFKHSDARMYHRFIIVIQSLGLDPYQGKKLKGSLADHFSLRIGSCRLIYRIFKDRLIVFVIDIGHRCEVYR